LFLIDTNHNTSQTLARITERPDLQSHQNFLTKMAGVSALPAKILLSKRVQEMVLNDEEPQKPYISRNDSTIEVIPSPPSDLIPIIDLSLLSSSEPCSAQELQRLRSALCSWGCFQV
jgi:hypothetical protein